MCARTFFRPWLCFVTNRTIHSKQNILDDIQNILPKILNAKHFYFYDIGCGNGKVLQRFTRLFPKLYGIEYDHDVYLKARDLHADSTNVEIIHQDALTYSFENHKSVVFLYEPFHTLGVETASKMYSSLMQNIRKINKEVYIVYISGVHSVMFSHAYFLRFTRQLTSVNYTNEYGSVLFKNKLIIGLL